MRLEPTVYVLSKVDKYTPKLTESSTLTDEEFIEQAEKFGEVYSLMGFQESFNIEYNSITNVFDCIRIIWRKTEDTSYGVEVSNYTNSEKYIDELPII